MKRIGYVRKRNSEVEPAATRIERAIFLCILLASAMVSSCSRTGASAATIADVCEMEDGSFVAVEGFLQLPNFLEAETNSQTRVTMYELFLAADPDGNSPTIKTRISGTSENTSNHIADLPADGYTHRDLRIFTANGETVGAADRVRISGEVEKEQYKNQQPCILKSEKIEKR